MAGSSEGCDIDFLALAFSTIARKWQLVEVGNGDGPVVCDAKRPTVQDRRQTRKKLTTTLASRVLGRLEHFDIYCAM